MTVDRSVFYVFVFSSLQSASPTTSEHVWLADVTKRSQTDKRTLSDIDLPNELTFHLRRGSENLTLNLRRNYDINPNADFYFARQLKNGQSALVKSQNLEKKDVAYYQDKENGAFMTVRCAKKANTMCERIINGNIRIGDSSYDLRPAENYIKPRSRLEAPDPLGNLYFLKHHSVIQSDLSAEMNDAAIVNKENVEQYLKALLKPLEQQRKANSFHPSDTKLSFQNEQALYDRVVTDKSRGQKSKEYYVKVAVLIDSGLWDFYSSLFPIADAQTKTEIVMQEIRVAFSHIMNGVNMIYKGIEDTSLSINIILTGFIVLSPETFQHTTSKVEQFKGKLKIEAKYYLHDVNTWDKNWGWKNAPVFNTGIIFTRYNLYVADKKNQIAGLTLPGGVCDAGTRMVVIESIDFFWTVFTTAHELGHSLGAEHDGESSTTKLCKAEDLFLMSAKFVSLNKTRSTKNPWKFSHCSVTSMKETLIKKKCVTKPGIFYNLQEYNDYVKKEPGEVYTSHDQCRLMVGPGSVCCKTVPEDICHKMRCSDPITGQCMTKIRGAARGTECGPNKWCIDAWCVSKNTATFR